MTGLCRGYLARCWKSSCRSEQRARVLVGVGLFSGSRESPRRLIGLFCKSGPPNIHRQNGRQRHVVSFRG